MNLRIVNLTTKDIDRGLKLPFTMDSKLAEDVGIHIGDGCISKYKNKKSYDYQISYSMNSIEDLLYSDYVKNLKQDLFGIIPKVSFKKGNELQLVIYSKTLALFYNKTLGIPIGNKKNINIPSSIVKENTLLKSCLRGIFDTDFSLSFKKKNGKKDYSYPVLMGCFNSKNLVKSIYFNLQKLEFTPNRCLIKRYDNRTKKVYNSYQVTLNGRQNLEKWRNLIGSNNPRLISRYEVWNKTGFLNPKSTVEQRIAILNINNKKTPWAGIEPLVYDQKSWS